MYQGLRILALIPARGGSKGVPRKNVRIAGGLPLIGWTIRAAQASAYLDRVVLSSEDAEIIAVAQSLGCEVPFVRPAELAQDDTSGIAPVLHALEQLPGFDLVVLLQPTSPLRTAADIDAAIARCVDSGAPTCISVTPLKHPLSWVFALGATGRLTSASFSAIATQRQAAASDMVELNGAVYVGRTEAVRADKTFLTAETVAYPMPAERSLDIDTEWDLAVFNAIKSGEINGTLHPPR